MGCFSSKHDSTLKRNKNHQRHKMFRMDFSFGRNDLNLEGHVQMGYNSKTVKNYANIPKLEGTESLPQIEGHKTEEEQDTAVINTHMDSVTL